MLAKEEAAGLHEMTRKKLFCATMSIFGSREVSAQEVSWFLLRFPFVFCSRTVVEVNVLPPGSRQRLLKTIPEMEQCEKDSIFVADLRC